MAGTVKARRPYVSPKHAALRRETRRAVVAAGRKLFAEKGYQATTIDALAAEAGVAVQTVYAAFGNKRSVLEALLETSVAGDDEQRTILERVREELAGIDDRADRLDRVLGFGHDLVERSADIHRILRGAAAGDEDLQQLLDEAEQRRYQDACGFIDLIAPERTARDRQHLADVLFTTTSYEVHDLLLRQRRWSAQQWRQWVRATLAPQLADD
jgi:TetR/AcrR family transcriptional regulator of autoinduction and epiphytic fitness